MTTPTQLTDTAALTQHRQRAKTAPALFLQEDVADEVEERLNEVNRTFTNPAIVTGFPELWAGRPIKAKIVADDETLALTPGAHDLVIHALCLHWANDPVGQLIQCQRALAPDGLFIGALFGGQTLYELRGALAEAEIALTGGLSPRVAPMGEIRDLGALLQRAGFALPVADSTKRQVSYRDTAHLMRDLRGMGETNALAARRRKTPPRQLFTEAARIYESTYADASGRIPATFEIVYLTGWAPDASQQKPLRPGSAQSRLADALGTDETPLTDTVIPKPD